MIDRIDKYDMVYLTSRDNELVMIYMKDKSW